MSDASDGGLVLFTLATAAGATLLMLPFGVGLGLVLARGRGPWHRLLEAVCLLPLVLPPTAVGLLLLVALDARGPLGRALEALGLPFLFTWRAVVLACAVMGFPLLVRAARDAFAQVDPRLVSMARSLGDGRARAFFRVALPLAGRGLTGGLLLAFARALGEFGATVLVAGNIPGRTQTLSLAIFQRVELGEDGAALRLVLVSGALAFAAVLAAGALERQGGAGR